MNRKLMIVIGIIIAAALIFFLYDPLSKKNGSSLVNSVIKNKSENIFFKPEFKELTFEEQYDIMYEFGEKKALEAAEIILFGTPEERSKFHKESPINNKIQKENLGELISYLNENEQNLDLEILGVQGRVVGIMLEADPLYIEGIKEGLMMEVHVKGLYTEGESYKFAQALNFDFNLKGELKRFSIFDYIALNKMDKKEEYLEKAKRLYLKRKREWIEEGKW